MKCKQKKLLTRLERLKNKSWKKSTRETARLAIEEIKNLQDEIDSVWFMLEEIKSSDIKEFRAMLETSVASKILDQIKKRKGKNRGTN